LIENNRLRLVKIVEEILYFLLRETKLERKSEIPDSLPDELPGTD